MLGRGKEILGVTKYNRALHSEPEKKNHDKFLTLPEKAKIYTDVFCN